jgi:hypothetical protein
MLDSKEHSDLVLYCNDGTAFEVHKAIVFAQAKFFLKACKPDTFKVVTQDNDRIG